LLVTRGDRLWNDQLAAISPLARGSGELDARLRSDTGLGDLRFVLAVEGATLDRGDQALRGSGTIDCGSFNRAGAIAAFDSQQRCCRAQRRSRAAGLRCQTRRRCASV
jgi:predicted exporter